MQITLYAAEWWGLSVMVRILLGVRPNKTDMEHVMRAAFLAALMAFACAASAAPIATYQIAGTVDIDPVYADMLADIWPDAPFELTLEIEESATLFRPVNLYGFIGSWQVTGAGGFLVIDEPGNREARITADFTQPMRSASAYPDEVIEQNGTYLYLYGAPGFITADGLLDANHWLSGFSQSYFSSSPDHPRASCQIDTMCGYYLQVASVTDITPVPAPSTLALFGLGLAGLVAMRRKT